ncbi:MAG: hypothetical protein RMK18_10205 [Armatimonadota bacterium]|nr:hypothetical protein [Armatimonadota bacterium]MCX7778191.1 hypothetical protein [Armatimonadota bacterium]MDW8026216.1 hypothetical protein [Armatimonadota bacterium]
MPKEGENGTIGATFKIRSFFHRVGGKPLNIYDSSISLLEEIENQKQRQFGFLLTWPEYSEGGKYKVIAGGDWVQTKQPFTNSIKNYEFLRITIRRREGKAFCQLQFSKDGSDWATLRYSAADLPKMVRIYIASCWGALTVDSVQVAV